MLCNKSGAGGGKGKNRSVGLGNVRKRTWILLFSSFFSTVCVPQRTDFCFPSLPESNTFQINGAGRIGTEIQQCIMLDNTSYLFQSTLCSGNIYSFQVYCPIKYIAKGRRVIQNVSEHAHILYCQGTMLYSLHCEYIYDKMSILRIYFDIPQILNQEHWIKSIWWFRELFV